MVVVQHTDSKQLTGAPPIRIMEVEVLVCISRNHLKIYARPAI